MMLIPVLASDTEGNRACIQNGRTGKLFACNDSNAIAEVLMWASNNHNELAAMGIIAIQLARTFTHWEMHRQRWQILAAKSQNMTPPH